MGEKNLRTEKLEINIGQFFDHKMEVESEITLERGTLK